MAGKGASFVVEFENADVRLVKRQIPRIQTQSLIGALKTKYCTDHEVQEFGYIFHGNPKKRSNSESDADLAYLTNVCLTNSSIRTSGLLEQSLKSLCPNIIDLDISGNLLHAWSEILPVVEQLHNLKFLNLARNDISKDTETLQTWTTTLPSIENLVLNQTGTAWQQIVHLAQLLPHLRELHVCRNNYSQIPSISYKGLETVQCLRMNDNQILNWEEIWKLRHLPNLKSLILSGNPLTDVYYRAGDPEISCSCSCHSNSSQYSNSSSYDENFQADVRQYCENILNCVIDEVIKSEILRKIDDSETQQNHTIDIAKEIAGHEVDAHGAGLASNACNENLAEKEEVCEVGEVGEHSEEGIEELSREIVDDVIRQAVEFMKTINQTGADADKASDITDSENDLNQSSESQITNAPSAEGDLGECPEESVKAESSCCSCEGKPTGREPFSSLESLCISETQIGKWKHLSALRVFPALKALRMKNVKLAVKLSNDDRRKLFLACLPNVKSLNGSEVTHSEREKSERHLLRHFSESKQKPDIYPILEQKHGALVPVVDIDISKGYQDYATLSFVYHGKVAFTEMVCVREPVGTLRKLISKRLTRSAGFATLYHKYCSPLHQNIENDCEPITSDSSPISRLDIMDGDEIHIDDSVPLHGTYKFYIGHKFGL